MHPYVQKVSLPFASAGQPSDELCVAITFKGPTGQAGPTKMATPLSADSILPMAPRSPDIDLALYELSKRGFHVSARGRYSATARIARKQFEELFGTTLEVRQQDTGMTDAPKAFYYPPEEAPWNPDPEIMELIDDA